LGYYLGDAFIARGLTINPQLNEDKIAFFNPLTVPSPRDYAPRATVYFEKKNFVIKTASNLSELEQLLRLRHQIFKCEFVGQPSTPGIDLDEYDAVADHLVILDRKTELVVGTYRLVASSFSRSFYSQSEFHLDALLSLPGTKLELSRACIDVDYRNGTVIHLLWRGIVDYMTKIGATLLFGCSSVKTTNSDEVADLMVYLKSTDQLDASLAIAPKLPYRFGQMIPSGRATDAKAIKEKLPALFHFYLRAGARVCGQPALDRTLECTDFLTLLKLNEIRKSYERKYL
jgi:putative hemolysin